MGDNNDRRSRDNMKLVGRLFTDPLFLAPLVLNLFLISFIVGAIRDSSHFLLISCLNTFVVNSAICIWRVFRLREPDKETMKSSDWVFIIPVIAISVTIGLVGIFMFRHQVFLKTLLLAIAMLYIPLACHTRNWLQKPGHQSK